MKSILVPVDQSEHMPSALETARFAANIFDSTVEGLAVHPTFVGYVTADALPIMISFNLEVHYCRVARGTFDAFAAQHPPERNGGARFRWRGGLAIDEGALGSLARVHDLTVISRPGSRGVRMPALEAVLFESGRPVLMAPPTPPRLFGQTVVIYWNASTETSRAIAMAMPILRKAKHVVLLTIEGSVVPGPSAKQALEHLAANGVPAMDKTVNPRGQRTGEIILAQAQALGADLLIKGAYTQSRLRQMIFGGATHHVLGNAELPVFLAH